MDKRFNIGFMCARCGGILLGSTAKATYKGFEYHVYCAYKIEQLEKEYADTLRQRQGDSPVLPKG